MTTIADEDRTVATGSLDRKQWVAAGLFALMALYLAFIVPTVEIAWVSGILLFTIYLFAFEVVGVDVAAATVMVLLGLTSLLAPLMGLEQGLVDTRYLFDGFSSNAVISIIAVMIIGAGLDKTGIMSKVATFILKVGGTTETRIIPIISATVGIISSFMQNVGAAALFLPVVSRISARSGLPMSRLLMPMGFCAILGGTVTMVGSSPLILLNDLILTSNQALPAEQQMETWGLFSVTPMGLALVATGIVYFVLAGRFVLPTTKSGGAKSTDTAQYLRDTYGLRYCMKEMVVPKDSALVGKPLYEVEHDDRVRVVAMLHGDDLRIGRNSLAGDVPFEANSVVGILASPRSSPNTSAWRYTRSLPPSATPWPRQRPASQRWSFRRARSSSARAPGTCGCARPTDYPCWPCTAVARPCARARASAICRFKAATPLSDTSPGVPWPVWRRTATSWW